MRPLRLKLIERTAFFERLSPPFPVASGDRRGPVGLGPVTTSPVAVRCLPSILPAQSGVEFPVLRFLIACRLRWETPRLRAMEFARMLPVGRSVDLPPQNEPECALQIGEPLLYGLQ
jgi:hypothetical protein